MQVTFQYGIIIPMLKNRYVWIVFLAILLYSIAFSMFRINDTDEGYIVTSSMRILAGELPYRDFFIHTPPLTFYAVAGVFKIFGQSLIVARLFTAVIGLAIAILLYLISLKIIPSVRYALIPPIIFMFWGTAQVNYPSFAWFGLLFALASAYSVVLFFEKKTVLPLICAGLLAGVSFISKQNLGLCVFAVSVPFLFKKLRWYIPSFIAPIAIAALIFYLQGALPDFIKHVFFTAARSGIERIEIFPYPSIKFPQLLIWGGYLLLFYLVIRRAVKGRSIAPFGFLMTGLLSLVVISMLIERALPVSNYILDHVKTGAIRGFYNFLVLSCVASIILSLRERKVVFLSVFALLYIWAGLFISRDMLHHIFTLPPTYILAGYIFYRAGLYVEKKDTWFHYYAVTLPLIYFLSVGFSANMNNEVFRDAEGPLYKMTSPLNIERAKFILADPLLAKDVTDTVNFIDKETAKSERIFYTYWPDGEIYFLADRLPASFFHFIHVDTVKPDDQASIINDIARNRARLVFMPKWRYDDRIALSEKANNNNTYDIEKYVSNNYRLKGTFGRFAVLERAD